MRYINLMIMLGIIAIMGAVKGVDSNAFFIGLCILGNGVINAHPFTTAK